MSQSEAKKIALEFANFLKGKGFPLASLYLFGSYAKGTQHKYSDIDIAVVSNLKRYTEKRAESLFHLCHEVDDRIEPHYFLVDDFRDDYPPLASEVKLTGIKIV